MTPRRKPIEIPSEVARKFAANTRAFHKEYYAIKRDEIVAETRHILLQQMAGASAT